MSYLRSTTRPLALSLLVVGGMLATGSHTVQPGETLTGIAARNGVSPSDIAAANGITDADHIQIGQTLEIPGAAGGGSGHTVAAGDTLAAIARRYRVSVSALVSANGLTDPNHIRTGAALEIPGGSNPAASTYTVAAGETLAAVARRHHVSIAALITANALDNPDHIRPGQTLAIPGGTGIATASQPAPNPVATARTHTVVRGDTLASIARRFDLSTAGLAAANKMSDPNLLRAGQVLDIPSSSNPSTASPGPASTIGSSPSVGSGGLPTAVVNDVTKAALVPVFDRWATTYDVPADLVKGLTWVESGWDANARSDVGAIGIGQLLAPTASFIAEDLLKEPGLDPANPNDNIRMTARWLRYLMDRTLTDREAIAAYYQGLAAVQRHGVYATTIAYVDGVTAARQAF